eukprot:659205-Rhodomonas_salina.1
MSDLARTSALCVSAWRLPDSRGPQVPLAAADCAAEATDPPPSQPRLLGADQRQVASRDRSERKVDGASSKCSELEHTYTHTHKKGSLHTPHTRLSPRTPLLFLYSTPLHRFGAPLRCLGEKRRSACSGCAPLHVQHSGSAPHTHLTCSSSAPRTHLKVGRGPWAMTRMAEQAPLSAAQG